MPLKPLLHNVRLVLASPMYSGNVGACARVAANFDVRDIRVVKPLCKIDDEQALRYAKGPAADYLGAMREQSSLEQALVGCQVAVGFSRRQRKNPLQEVSLEELIELVSVDATAGSGAIALIFGREDGGLSADELLHCTHFCTLPTSERMPSLNLSHAVAVVLARLYSKKQEVKKQDQNGVVAIETSPDQHAPLEEQEALFSHWREMMVDADITRAGNPDRMLEHIRRVLQRANPTEQEIKILRAYLNKTQVALGTRTRGKPKPKT